MNHIFPSTLLAIGKDWWLPANYSKHGVEVDMLFNWIFWITMIIFIVTEAVMVIFLIKYRQRPGKRKAHYTHGHTQLEMAWTIAPAIILAVLALASKRVWDNFRFSPDMDDPGRAKVLVVGEQFKWNIVYPGLDGKFGRYLLFPKPTDVAWPPGPSGRSVNFDGVPGPSALPYDRALTSIAKFIDTENKLGKDHTDADGKDDDYQAALGRTLFVPVNRPIEVQIGSKDVIHDFFLPNFRAQLYAVPGMRGRFAFTATVTTKELESASKQKFKTAELPAMILTPKYKELIIDIDETSPGALKDRIGWRYASDPARPASPSIIRNGLGFAPGVAEKLQAAGITEVTAHLPGYLDIACAQICGLGHYKMNGQVVVLSQEEFDQKFPSVPHVPVKTAMAAAK